VSPRTRFAHLAIFLATLAWGASFVATKAALRELSPVSLIVLRFGIGVTTLVLLLLVRRQPVVPPRGAVPALAAVRPPALAPHARRPARAAGPSRLERPLTWGDLRSEHWPDATAAAVRPAATSCARRSPAPPVCC